MEKLLNFLTNITLTELEKLKKELKNSIVCKPMNELAETLLDKDGIKLFLNPSNQKCFNFGYFTYQDYYDWLKGEGKIVKGNTPEEKSKYFEVAIFEATHARYGWAVGYYKKYFGYIDENFIMKADYTGYITHVPVVPLKITKTNHKEIIAKVFGDICGFYKSVDLEKNDHMERIVQGELDAASRILYLLGVGYNGASNKPEDPLNLLWVKDICLYKIVYLNYIQRGVKLPDFDFVYGNEIKKEED